MLKKYLLAFLLPSVFCLSAQASELSYTNVTLGYAWLEAVDEDFSGYEVKGSWQVGEGAYLFASTNDLSSDDAIAGTDGPGARERDLSVTEVGGGLIFTVNDSLDLNASIAFVGQSGDSAIELDDGDGFTVGLGLRSMVSSKVETGVSLKYRNIEEEPSTTAMVSSRYFLRKAISAGASYLYNDDIDGWSLDIRIDF